MAEIAEAVKVHVFEQAGLGKAPFRYGGCSREVYVACPGAPVQPGGCCDYCGNGIMYEFHLEGADGKRFKVGSECIMKAGDGGLKRVVKEEIARMNRAKAAEKRALDHGWLLNLLSHPEVADVLAAKPHPLDWAKAKGLTLLDWATWMACNGGGSAWAATLKRVRAECGIAKPERGSARWMWRCTATAARAGQPSTSSAIPRGG